MVKQRDFQKDPQKQLLNQSSGQRKHSANRLIKKVITIIVIVDMVLIYVYVSVSLPQLQAALQTDWNLEPQMLHQTCPDGRLVLGLVLNCLWWEQKRKRHREGQG